MTMPNLLQAKLTKQQLTLMSLMSGPFSANGQWPVWHYVVTKMDRLNLDAEELLKSLPYVGDRSVGRSSYGLAWFDHNQLADDSRPSLTMAAALHLPEFGRVAYGLLRLTEYFIERQLAAPASPNSVQHNFVEADEVAQRFPDLTPEFMRAVPRLLQHEPLLSRGVQGWYTKPNGAESWRYELHRHIIRFQGVGPKLHTYVKRQVEEVERSEREQSVRFGRTSLVHFATAALEAAPSEEVLTPTVTPVVEPKLYVNAGLRNELVEKQGKTTLSVDKLIALLHELDDNYADGHAYSCHALLRAVIDHVPPILGHKSFEAAVNNYTWSRTDKKYMTRLLDFKTQADDVLHRQIRASADVISMHDLPQAAALNALLRVCIDQLQ
ncbi:hypothetical protein [Streptomyces mirabilis]|uniref:hypothetical protein n=1 Tax=Streptomyces mirabilis TaxID=68239 RepID=UPI00340E27A6